MTDADVKNLKFLYQAITTGRARDLRKRIGLSPADVANQIGVHKSQVPRWEAGATRPRLQHALRYAEFLRGLDELAA